MPLNTLLIFSGLERVRLFACVSASWEHKNKNNAAVHTHALSPHLPMFIVTGGRGALKQHLATQLRVGWALVRTASFVYGNEDDVLHVLLFRSK